ncbi:hypothetical protein QQS21_008846 [Conoideocrella luteorostrata]|uniref:Uncharacterized protein n=1 Tax=Conoideocrella luteorostrata TaxID=1105319 RepID=A0AAJ0FW73_9HYPO|nr:hypothetical protein QQS21_008846 [Conoideocrella luteorostrata]
MSLPGMIFISVLLCMDLVFLLALAVYSALTPRWTARLDAFAMMRIGASIGQEQLPLRIAHKMNHVKMLDRLPGWMGDVMELDEYGDEKPNRIPKEIRLGGCRGIISAAADDDSDDKSGFGW